MKKKKYLMECRHLMLRVIHHVVFPHHKFHKCFKIQENEGIFRLVLFVLRQFCMTLTMT